jgi:predicted enzyme related to lactoylglutathione lyase
MDKIQLGGVILAVRDFPKMVKFYRDAFGWDQTVDSDVYVEFCLPGGSRVGLYERVAFGINTDEVPVNIPKGALSPTELYLLVDDPEQAMESLRAAGARLLSPFRARSWGDAAAYYADPEGNVIAVASSSAPGC